MVLEMRDIVTWAVAAITLFFLLKLLWGEWKVQRSSRISKSTKRDSLIAVRSGVIFVSMAVPLLIPGCYSSFPENFREIYKWLPFWYAYSVLQHWGPVIENCVNALKGAVVATTFMAFMNYLMPGGAVVFPREISQAWIPGGYRREIALPLGIAFAYLMFFSNAAKLTKQWGLGVFAPIFVSFLNPHHDADQFEGVLWDYHFRPTFSGPVWSQIFQLLLALTCAFLTLPVLALPCSLCPRPTCSCRHDAVEGYSQLAQDTVMSLERLVMHFRDGSTAYALDSSALYFKQLGARREMLEELLLGAKWEAPGRKLQALKKLTRLLQGLRQVLRILLEDLRQFGHSFAGGEEVSGIAVQLDSYLASFRDAVSAVASPQVLMLGVGSAEIEQLSMCLRDAKSALKDALEDLQPGLEGKRVKLEAIFVESLFTCVALMEQEYFGKEKAKESLWAWFWRRLWRGPAVTRARFLNAARLTISWSLALSWSVHKRDYSAGAVVTASVVFSDSLGDLWKKSMQRMLGVAMGQTLGTLPALLLTTQNHLPEDTRTVLQFNSVASLLIYLVMMFMMWTVAMYGYFAKNSRISYACLLWAGFGSVQMLDLLPIGAEVVQTRQEVVSIFSGLVDGFVSCLILLTTDIIFAMCTSDMTVQKIARAVPDCLRNVTNLVEEFASKAPGDVDIGRLKESIKKVRELDNATMQEEMAWTQLIIADYNKDLVSATMDECDDIFVASYALQSSAERCKAFEGLWGCPGGVPELIRELIPQGLMAKVSRYPAIARAALLEEECPADEKGQSGEIFCKGMDLETCVSFGESQRSSSFGNMADELEAGMPEVGAQVTLGMAAKAAAALALRVRIWQLCFSLQRLGVIFREHAFWAAEDWSNPEELVGTRQMSVARMATMDRSRLRMVTIDSSMESALAAESRQLRRVMTQDVEYAAGNPPTRTLESQLARCLSRSLTRDSLGVAVDSRQRSFSGESPRDFMPNPLAGYQSPGMRRQGSVGSQALTAILERGGSGMSKDSQGSDELWREEGDPVQTARGNVLHTNDHEKYLPRLLGGQTHVRKA